MLNLHRLHFVEIKKGEYKTIYKTNILLYIKTKIKNIKLTFFNIALYGLIYSNLTTLKEINNHYIPGISVPLYDWIRNPFVESTSERCGSNLTEAEELIDICNDHTLD